MNNELREYVNLLFANPLAGSVGAALLGVVNFMYGTGITLTAILIFAGLVVLDWLSGRAASRKDGTMASEYGINGTYRVAFIMGILFIAYRVDLALDLPYVCFGYFLINFGEPMWRSMTANVYRAGWHVWIPKGVLERVGDEIAHKNARANKRIEELRNYTDKKIN